MFSSFRPTSSETTWPPVRIAMSWSIALRRSPKPGALIATDLNVPRILLTTSVARASPSTSSAMMASGLPPCMTFSSTGSRSLTAAIFGRDEQEVGVVEDGLHALGVGDEVRGDVALVEAHALDEVELHPEGLALLDGDDPVVADLLERLGDHRADLLVGRGDRGDVGDLRPGRSRPSGRPDLIESTAVLDRRPRCPSSGPSGWRRPRRCAGPRGPCAQASTVAVVVPSPATSSVFLATSLTSSAPIFSYGSSRSISLAMETPSLVIVGAPHFFSSTTLRPLGPRVTRTASASLFMPSSSERRAFSS